jgi:hypothetical protein
VLSRSNPPFYREFAMCLSGARERLESLSRDASRCASRTYGPEKSGKETVFGKGIRLHARLMGGAL